MQVGRRTAAQRWGLHPAQHPCDPPVAGHDDAADDPPALVAVGVGVVAQEGLADPPAVAVGAAALGTAVASLIPQGVELQPILRLSGRGSVSMARGACGWDTPGTWTGHLGRVVRAPREHGQVTPEAWTGHPQVTPEARTGHPQEYDHDTPGAQPGHPQRMDRSP